MKINKLFLSKIIKEEIKKVLIESESLREEEGTKVQQVIRIFANYFQDQESQTVDPETRALKTKKLKDDLDDVFPQISVGELLSKLEVGTDPQLFTKVKQLLDSDFSPYGDKSDSSDYRSAPENELYGQGKFNPKEDPQFAHTDPQRQLDPRKNRKGEDHKNLVH